MDTRRVTVSRFEGDLQAIATGVPLYRRGVDKLFLSRYSWIYEQLEGAHQGLESIGMYEHCRQALLQAEALMHQGPEHDEEAVALLLKAGSELALASGSFERYTRQRQAHHGGAVA